MYNNTIGIANMYMYNNMICIAQLNTFSCANKKVIIYC